MALKQFTGAEVREHRRRLGLNQSDFWTTLKVTQSGGSRYESDREIPLPVQLILNIALCSESKSSAIVEELRALAKPPKKSTPSVKVSRQFGLLP